MIETAWFPAKRRISFWMKLNPLWWVCNTDDDPPPGYSMVRWFLRNPFHNFQFYVIGCADKDHHVTGIEPKRVLLADIGLRGWKWHRIGWRPFVSYSGRTVRAYLGWRPDGAFGAKFNR